MPHGGLAYLARLSIKSAPGRLIEMKNSEMLRKHLGIPLLLTYVCFNILDRLHVTEMGVPEAAAGRGSNDRLGP